MNVSRTHRNRNERMAIGLAMSASVAALFCMVVSTAAADVDFYLEPSFGFSGFVADVSGSASNGVGGLLPGFSGSDTDFSPIAGLGVGLEMPLDEVVPREWLADLRLPNWPIRFELEASGPRESDLVTNGVGPENYFSEISAVTTFTNVWLDVPMTSIWRPVQYVFGLGRQPRVRSWIEPMSFYLGSGIGFAALTFEGTDNTFETDDDIIDFAWNVGAGFRYKMNDWFTLSMGYRYVGLGPNTGSQEVDLERRAGGGAASDSLEYDYQVHELRIGLQFKAFSFRGAWR